MIIPQAKDFTGYSENSLDEAISDALQQARDHAHVEVIETCSSMHPEKSQYHVTLTAVED